MSTYKSVDSLQKAFAETVFPNRDAPKKAAGRALGTMVELITFYMLRSWDLETRTAIERPLPEYGNSSITHNVEFTLHPKIESRDLRVYDRSKSQTFAQVCKENPSMGALLSTLPKEDRGKGNIWAKATDRSAATIRHSWIMANADDRFWVGYLGQSDKYTASLLGNSPYAMIECKRVGVEEGQKKGPQTIEKAKQGAYVARSVSGLQRVPRKNGKVAAVVENAEGELRTHENYYEFIRDAIDSEDIDNLKNVVLTIGVASNHGNWFTSDNQNKEMRVLAQSYDWMLFLTDQALAGFIEDTLLSEDDKYSHIKSAFGMSYGGKARNNFTKVLINSEADRQLTEYFNAVDWGKWFNVIGPAGHSLEELKNDLHLLGSIKEREIGLG